MPLLPDLPQLLTFAAASFVLIVVPGPAVLYIVARSLDQGRAAGMVSVLGVSIGEYLQITAAAFGLAALVLSSALAFSVLKIAGALYLIYLGIRRLLEKDRISEPGAVRREPLMKSFRESAVVAFLNPKAALFVLAFFPQFVDPARGSVAVQMLLLGLIFVSIALISDSVYALAAGTLREHVRPTANRLRAQRCFSGTSYIGLGVATAFAGNSKD